jgi:hypothetical protein
MTLVKICCMPRAKQKQQILLVSVFFYTRLYAIFLFSVLSFFLSPPLSLSLSCSVFLLGEGEVVFLLCKCVREGVYMTRLLVDDKTFKNIRCCCRCRSCFPLRVFSCVVVFWLYFFNISTQLTTETREFQWLLLLLLLLLSCNVVI